MIQDNKDDDIPIANIMKRIIGNVTKSQDKATQEKEEDEDNSEKEEETASKDEEEHYVEALKCNEFMERLSDAQLLKTVLVGHDYPKLIKEFVI